MTTITRFISLILLAGTVICAQAQTEFTDIYRLDCTPVKSQGKTGTCWCFSTLSFLESELLRKGLPAMDLSEMHLVRSIYEDKAQNYILRQGKANFSQGSLAHDVFRAMDKVGIVPESAYSGKSDLDAAHNHKVLEKQLKSMVQSAVQDDKKEMRGLSAKWKAEFIATIDSILGPTPEYVEYEGQQFTPHQFMEYLELDSDNYVHLTSFTHHNFYDEFILEIPDNYSNGSFFNLPLEELMKVVDHALESGFTLTWDGDVSEPGFDAKKGLAVYAGVQPKESGMFTAGSSDPKMLQANRQAAFENYETTDDHLMHVIGTAKSPSGEKYYIIKNSWGEISPHQGYIYMSRTYFMMKTVAVTVHIDGLPESVQTRL